LGLGLGLAGTGLGAAGPRPGRAAENAGPADGDGKPLKVAALVTEFTYRSHAHVILENFLGPYLFNGKKTDPGAEVVALYVDQTPGGDMSKAVAKEYGFTIYPTIAGALCRGGDALAVDAVLSIAEQGRYPVNAKAQREYPRKRFFDEVVAVFRKSGAVAPVFNDKHLSYRWDWAREMVDTARQMQIPLMAGSSVPLAQRRPPMEIPAGSEFASAVSIHGGPLEGYDFHGLEVLQSVVESRRGGETGISSVQFLQGDALFDAFEAEVWPIKLSDAAMAAEIGRGKPTLRELVKSPPFNRQPPHAILLNYKDGLRAAVVRVGSSGTRWDFAGLVVGDDEPRATSFYVGPWENRNLFKALAHAIQTFFRERQPPYPVERTLLTTGALDAAMESRVKKSQPVPTPHLEFSYEPLDFRPMREMGETWKILTPNTPQPRGIDTSGRRAGA
jgi:hypothetical protein